MPAQTVTVVALGGPANALPNDEGGEPGGGDGPANPISMEARNSSGQGGSSATPGGEHAWSGPAAEGHRFEIGRAHV